MKHLTAYLFFCLLTLAFTTISFPPEASATTCGQYAADWANINNPNSRYHGRIGFCAGGFSSPRELKSSSLRFRCTGDSCGGLLNQLARIFSGDSGQTVSLSSTPDSEIGEGPPGKFFTCVSGDLDSAILQVVQNNVSAQNALCTIAQVSQLALDPSSFIMQIAGGSGCDLSSAPLVGLPTLTGELLDSNGQSLCQDSRQITVNEVQTSSWGGTVPFNLCGQAGPAGSPMFQACMDCVNQSAGLATAIGCIPVDLTSITQSLVRLNVAIAGGLALALILLGAFTVSTATCSALAKTSSMKVR